MIKQTLSFLVASGLLLSGFSPAQAQWNANRRIPTQYTRNVARPTYNTSTATNAYAQTRMTPRQAIYYHASKGNTQNLYKLKQMGYQIDLADAKGNSALCEAVWRQDRTAVSALISVGANQGAGCMQQIPANYKTAMGINSASGYSSYYGTKTATATATSSGLSTGAMVGIGVGAAALIGGGIALAAGGGGGGGSGSSNSTSKTEDVSCNGHGTKEDSGVCVCDANYIGNNCEYKKIENCASQNGNICTTCNSNYHKSTDGKICYSNNINKCQTYTNTTCSTCESGYHLSTDNKTCYQNNITGCSTYLNETCSACDGDYHLSTDKKTCYANNITNCTSYTNDSCSVCQSGYHVSTDNKTCYQNNISNCEVYTNTTCMTCKTNYIPSSDGTQCFVKIAGCTSYNSTGGCTACDETNYTLSGTTCTRTTAYDEIQNCAVQSEDICTTCATGYHKSSDSKNCLINNITNCTNYNNTTCIQCETGYTVANNGSQCYTKVENCQIQSNADCISCQDGYELNNNTCTVIGGGTSSTVCGTNYYLSGDSCIACVHGISAGGHTSQCICTEPQWGGPACNQCQLTGGNYDATTCTCNAGYSQIGLMCISNPNGMIFFKGTQVGTDSYTINQSATISGLYETTYGIDVPMIAAAGPVGGVYPEVTVASGVTLTNTIKEPNYDYTRIGLTETNYIAYLNHAKLTNNGILNGSVMSVSSDIENNNTIDGKIFFWEGGQFINNGTLTETGASVDETSLNISFPFNSTPGTFINNGNIQYDWFTIESDRQRMSGGIDICGSNTTFINNNQINSSINLNEAKFINKGATYGDLIIRGAAVENTSEGIIHTGDLWMTNNSTFINNGHISFDAQGSTVHDLEGHAMNWPLLIQGGTFVNNGSIEVDATYNAGFGAIDIEGFHGVDSKFYNKGTITYKNGEFSPAIHAVGSQAYVYNSGIINLQNFAHHTNEWVNGQEVIIILNESTTGYQGTPANNDNHYIWLEDGASMLTSGTIDAGISSLNMASFSPDGTGKIVLEPKAVLASQKGISGNAYMSNAFITDNFKDTVVAKDMIQTPDASDLKLISESALFDAKLADNGSDVVMKMKNFTDVVPNKSLAQFLANNYALANNAEFYNKLKSFDNLSSLNNSLNQLTGKDVLSRFNFEDMSMMRELNYDMNNNLFHSKENHLSMAGSVSPMAFKGDTGSNSRYSLFSQKHDNTSIGLGIAFTDTRSDDDHESNNRHETMYQMIVPFGYKAGGFNMITSPRIGYARGEYDRTGFDGANYDGTLEKRVYGVMNEARYPFKVAGWSFEPSLEFNVLGYQQKGSEDGRQFSLHVPNQQTLSVEGGMGFYATKETELSHGKVNLSAGLALYHEFADPYKLKLGMEGMDGSFEVRDENRSDNRAVARAGFNYTNDDNLEIYGSILSYIDKEARTKANTGMKWKF